MAADTPKTVYAALADEDSGTAALAA